MQHAKSSIGVMQYLALVASIIFNTEQHFAFCPNGRGAVRSMVYAFSVIFMKLVFCNVCKLCL
jgi:hypothetical protein